MKQVSIKIDPEIYRIFTLLVTITEKLSMLNSNNQNSNNKKGCIYLKLYVRYDITYMEMYAEISFTVQIFRVFLDNISVTNEIGQQICEKKNQKTELP